MGTSTIFQRYNDIGGRLSEMSKKELESIDAASPWKKEGASLPGGWRVPLELHNGNVHVLVWWKGQLMRLEDATKSLHRKYYDKYSGKTLRTYEWTIFKRFCRMMLEEADKEFRKSVRRRNRTEHNRQILQGSFPNNRIPFLTVSDWIDLNQLSEIPSPCV